MSYSEKVNECLLDFMDKIIDFILIIRDNKQIKEIQYIDDNMDAKFNLQHAYKYNIFKNIIEENPSWLVPIPKTIIIEFYTSENEQQTLVEQWFFIFEHKNSYELQNNQTIIRNHEQFNKYLEVLTRTISQFLFLNPIFMHINTHPEVMLSKKIHLSLKTSQKFDQNVNVKTFEKNYPLLHHNFQFKLHYQQNNKCLKNLQILDPIFVLDMEEKDVNELWGEESPANKNIQMENRQRKMTDQVYMHSPRSLEKTIPKIPIKRQQYLEQFKEKVKKIQSQLTHIKDPFIKLRTTLTIVEKD